MIMMISASLSSYHEKAAEALDESKLAEELPSFASFPVEFLLLDSLIYCLLDSPSRNKHCKASYPRMQQRDLVGS